MCLETKCTQCVGSGSSLSRQCFLTLYCVHTQTRSDSSASRGGNNQLVEVETTRRRVCHETKTISTKTISFPEEVFDACGFLKWLLAVAGLMHTLGSAPVVVLGLSAPKMPVHSPWCLSSGWIHDRETQIHTLLWRLFLVDDGVQCNTDQGPLPSVHYLRLPFKAL